MADLTRRGFLGGLGALVAVAQQSGASGGQAATPRYDLLIAGGRVVDPSQALSAQRDIAIAAGAIVRIDANIPRHQARDVLDARGKIVTPGLIDMHGHVYDSAIPISVDPDAVGISKGVTTIVDAGSTGASTFAGFRKYVIERAATRVYALLNLSSIGLVVTNELYLDPTLLDPKAAVRVIEQNRDRILGLKVRITGRPQDRARDVEIMRLARQTADRAAVPIMMHWSNDTEVLSLLEQGDIITHPFNPPQVGPSLLDAAGRILPQILRLRERGVFTDFAHGSHLQWTIAEKAAEQGWFPDVISTDIHRAHAAPPGVVLDLPTTMAKFMYLGLSLEETVARVTSKPATMLGFPERLGTLQAGAAADVAVFDLMEGEVDLLDSLREKRVGTRNLVPVATIRSGKLMQT